MVSSIRASEIEALCFQDSIYYKASLFNLQSTFPKELICPL